MGYNDDFDGFEDYDTDSSNPSELRKAQKAAAKRAKDLEEQVAKLTRQLSERNLKDVLAEKGLRPGLARVIVKEDVDLTDPKAIDAWLSEPTNQEDFQFTLTGGGANDGGANDGSDEGAGGDENSDYAAEYARMQGASQGALPDNRFAEAERQIKGSKSTAETQAALNRAIGNINP